MINANVFVTSTVVKAGITRPSVSINQYADSDFRRPPSARPMKDAVADLEPGYFRFGDGFNICETSWLLKPSYTEEGCEVFVSGWNMYPSNDPNIVKPSWRSPGQGKTRGTLMLSELSNISPPGAIKIGGIAFSGLYAVNTGGAINYVASRGELKAHANALVHYNKNGNIGITHWEIGNETFGYPHNAVATASNLQVYINDVQEFVDLVKAADPDARVGVNAMRSSEFTALCEGLTNIDFLVPHNYAPYGNPNTYPQYASYGNVNLAGLSRNAVDGLVNSNISLSEKSRIQVITTEAAAMDFSTSPYPRTNNVGLGLLQFDLIGQHVSNVGIHGVCMWNTRGFNEGRDGLPHLLNRDNELLPMGHALSLWATNIPRDSGVVFTNRDLTGILCYAVANVDTTNVFLVNKKETGVSANVVLTISLPCVSREIYTGTSYQSTSVLRTSNTIPSFGSFGSGLRGDVILPPVSITVLQFGTYKAPWLPTANITVSQQVVGPLRKPGVSMNALLDSDLNRPSANVTFKDAMRALSPASIQYPGGPIAVGFSWASAPFTSPAATLTRISTNDFPSNNAQFWSTPGAAGGSLVNVVQYNEFVDVCSYSNALNITQVDIDSRFKTQNVITPSMANIIISTAGLITYNGNSNVVYEIGHQPSVASDDPVTFAQSVNQLTANMKAAGARVIVCNGHNPVFWGANLPNVDYVGVRNYPIVNFPGLANFSSNTSVYTADPRFDYFSNNRIDYTAVNRTVKCFSRKPVAVTDTNPYETNGAGWTVNNDVSRFLMAFELVGNQLASSEYLTYFNTRNNNMPGILDNNNELLPTGYAIRAFTYGYDLLGGGNFVSADSDSVHITVFAANRNERSVVWVLNKSRGRHPIRINVNSLVPLTSVISYRGEQPTDATIVTENLTLSGFSKRDNFVLGYVEKLSVTVFHF